MKKRKPKKTKPKDEDRISSLPDCLLVDIISRLPETKEAIRTSTLSKRWQHLFPQVHNLVFEQCDDCEHTIRKFFSFVDRFLTLRGQLNINKFTLHCSFDTETESQLNSFIRYAVDNNVQEVDLYIWENDLDSGFVLPEFLCFSSSLIHLRLYDCDFYQDCVISWKNLKSFSIEASVLGDDTIQDIVSGSPRLETLVFNGCEGFEQLNITNKSVKNLVLYGLDWHTDNFTVIINAPYILSLTIGYDWVLELFLTNVSSVIKAELNYSGGSRLEAKGKRHRAMLKGLIGSLGHVKELKIGKSCLEALARLKSEGLVCPSNLKVLEGSDSN